MLNTSTSHMCCMDISGEFPSTLIAHLSITIDPCVKDLWYYVVLNYGHVYKTDKNNCYRPEAF